MMAFNEVAKIQKMRPGWRFSLLGGDISYDYNRTKSGSIRKRGSINYKKTTMFGWRAEFFGHIDPSKCYGQRHAEGTGWTAEEAILDACAKARKAIEIEWSGEADAKRDA